MTAILKITDGTTSIDLINSPDACGGFYLSEWIPQVSGYKNDGTWQDSSLANGRTLAMRRFASVVETFTLHASGTSQDALVRYVQDLRRLLEKAADYWTTEWQDEPVWLEARASCETNTRYSLVSAGRIAEDKNPYSQPFMSAGGIAVFDSLTLVVEREPFWRHVEPGEGECVPLSAVECYCEPNYIEYNGDTTSLDCGGPAKLDNLPDNGVAGKGPITVDGWIRADSYGEDPTIGGYIAHKGIGWYFTITNADGLCALINCALLDADSRSGLDEFTADGLWHHVVMTYDETGAGTPVARTLYLAIDGTWVASYSTQIASLGNYSQETGVSLIIGNTAAGNLCFDGGIGWMRVSDNIRFAVGADFTPPPRCALPTPDANTMWLGIREGTGTTVYDLSATPSNGTLANGTWDCDCDQCYGNVLGDCGPAYLEFNGDTSDVNCGSGASIDDLPDNAVAGKGSITAHGWIRADGWGENNQGQIAVKGSGDLTTRGWHFNLTSSVGIRTTVVCAGQRAQSDSGLDEFTPDGLWHHVLMCYSETGAGVPAARTIYLAIDGTWITSYSTQQVSIGNYAADNGDDLIIGNNSLGNLCFDGDIGWIAVDEAITYTPGTNFTPPARCALPPVATNNRLSVIYEGVGLTTHDRSGNVNDGTISLCMWACDCYSVSAYSGLTLSGVTREPTCDDEVYIANKRNVAQITNVHWWDASAAAWSANLQDGALPIPLLPAAPAVGDVVVFGIDTTLLDSGPFCSLVFDLLTAQTDLTITWRYSQGAANPLAWPALTVQDNTDADGAMTGQAFDTTGVNSVHWVQPGNWATFDPDPTGANALGTTGYWVAAHVTAIGAAPAPPVQQNRDIYSIVWPYVEIQEADVEGDVFALAQIVATYQSISGGDDLSNFISGLRSTSRGLDFTAYINFADEQNPTGIAITAHGATTIVNRITAPTGRAAYFNPVGIIGALNEQVRVTFSDALSLQYVGRFRAYTRVYQVGGLADDFNIQLRTDFGNRFISESIPVTATNDFTVIEFGSFSLGDGLNPTDVYESPSVSLYLNNPTNAAPGVLYIYDLILVPVDEIALEQQYTGTLTDRYEYDTKLDADSVTVPKKEVRSILRVVSDDAIRSQWRPIIPSALGLHSNARQRLWFFTFGPSFALRLGEPYYSSTITSEHVRRYFSLRGNR